MEKVTRKKIVLSLLDSDPKSANKIADEIGESLADIEGQLTALVSENICEKVNQNGVDQYVVKKDIGTFAQLVNEFLSDKEEHKDQIEQFITSDYYIARIDGELVDYVLKRFYIDSVLKTDEDIESTRRVLVASPSALNFALHADTAKSRESWEHRNELNPSSEDRKRITETVRSGFMTSLTENLFDDLRDSPYGSLYDKLQIRMIKTNIQVSLATPHGQYVEAIGQGITALCRVDENLMESLRPGQWVTFVDPMDFSNYGLALLYLGEFQEALRDFDKALDQVKDPIQKATVLNNKGFAFLRLRQYQKAIECFKEGIAFDVDGKISELLENRQIAEELLVLATDADNLTEPTQIRFLLNQPVPFEETLSYEFKEIGGGNAIRSIRDTSDIYAVAFLNDKKGGRIFWGIRNKDRITIGVSLNEQQRDELRVKVSEKLGAVQPSIVGHWQLELHPVYDLQGEVVEDLWVVELLVSPPQRRDIFYTGKGELHVKTEGGKKKLLGIEVTEFIRRHFQNDTETE